ncbi:YkgJ family cysteine cluster protein [Enterococcus avium]|uniref:YkgJ family cysteine cluster protein n=1 Tax=Enterococcus avium TaxID=33945 RepID=UPI001D086211|nr:YkgJ family cysteine cluster protein [Enterococcus avium]MCB6916224.1 YkgJ family cysteine cluster protein [Enterococcus avium]MCQ4960080.1 YkgJ family cysteine cluster protein [Enterococcus avium]
MSRNDPCFCGSGKKTKKCHSSIKENTKLADICIANVSFDRKVNQEKIQANCRENCSACCSDFFFVSENEFLLILDGLERKGGKKLIDNYIQKALEYQSYLMEKYPETLKALDSFMPQGTPNESKSYFNDNFDWDRSKPCIFLESGKCTIYENRPLICRTYGVCDTCEIICNPTRHFEEEKKLLEGMMLNGDEVILKRPYPLFYYFSYFLREEYFDQVMTKLSLIRTLPEYQYTNYYRDLYKKINNG